MADALSCLPWHLAAAFFSHDSTHAPAPPRPTQPRKSAQNAVSPPCAYTVPPQDKECVCAFEIRAVHRTQNLSEALCGIRRQVNRDLVTALLVIIHLPTSHDVCQACHHGAREVTNGWQGGGGGKNTLCSTRGRGGLFNTACQGLPSGLPVYCRWKVFRKEEGEGVEHGGGDEFNPCQSPPAKTCPP